MHITILYQLQMAPWQSHIKLYVKWSSSDWPCGTNQCRVPLDPPTLTPYYAPKFQRMLGLVGGLYIRLGKGNESYKYQGMHDNTALGQYVVAQY